MSSSRSSNALHARELLYRNVRGFFSTQQFEGQQIVELEGSLFPFNMPAHQSACFQISKQIHHEPTDRRHCHEFTVLQWSQLDWTNEQVLSDVDSFLMAIFSGDFEPERRTFRQAFIQRLGFDPDELSAADLRQEARRLGLNVSLGEDRLAWLKLMFIHFIEPTLGIDIPLYLTDLPSQWRRDTANHDDRTINSTVDIYIDGIKVGSVLSVEGNLIVDQQPKSRTMNIVFGLDRLLMIILETRQIEKVICHD